jgi:hypothetical protein
MAARKTQDFLRCRSYAPAAQTKFTGAESARSLNNSMGRVGFTLQALMPVPQAFDQCGDVQLPPNLPPPSGGTEWTTRQEQLPPHPTLRILMILSRCRAFATKTEASSVSHMICCPWAAFPILQGRNGAVEGREKWLEWTCKVLAQAKTRNAQVKRKSLIGIGSGTHCVTNAHAAGTKSGHRAPRLERS